MTDITVIPKEVLAEQWYSILQTTLGTLQAAFRKCGLTKEAIAHRIGKDPAVVNRCLRGRQNMTLRTMHELARAMGFRLRIELDRLDDLPIANRRPSKESAGAIVTPPKPSAPPVKKYSSANGFAEGSTAEPEYA